MNEHAKALRPPFGGSDYSEQTKILRLTLADGAWVEKELPAEWDNESACHYILNNLPDNAATPVGLCRPISGGSGSARKLDDALERVLAVRRAGLLYPQTIYDDADAEYWPDDPYNDHCIGKLPDPDDAGRIALAADRHDEENILDADLPAASDALPDMKFTNLCHMAIEIANGPPLEGPGKEQVTEFLRDINLEIAKRTTFWTLIVATIAYAACVASGVIALYLAGGVMLASSQRWIQGGFTAGAVVAAAGIANKRLIALENWAATWAANLAMRRREGLERKELEKSEGIAVRSCASCARYLEDESDNEFHCGLSGRAVEMGHSCDEWLRW